MKRSKSKDRKKKKVRKRAQRKARKRGEQKAAKNRRKRSGEAGEKTFETLMQMLRPKVALVETMAALAESPERVSTSQAFGAFVEPYAELADTEEAYLALLNLAMMAWNAALLPEEGREELLEEALGKFPRGFREEGAQVVRELMARKEQLFPENRHLILDFEIVDTGERGRLVAVSTMDGFPAKPGSRAEPPPG